MSRAIDTRDAAGVEDEVHSIYATLFPGTASNFVRTAFGWAVRCFAGGHPDYLPIDARYHDLEHTMQGALCLARLMRGLHAADAAPALTVRAFELGIVGILFHDIGYLKVRSDTEGTGAKYTAVHVGRSVAFAEAFLAPKGFMPTEVRAVQNMINCTGISTDLQAIEFQSEQERALGYALATSDLLGQMAAPDYVEKLPVLYQEFAEAARHAPAGLAHLYAYKSARELMRNTPVFWEKYVLPKINGDFRGLYRFLGHPHPDGPNEYLQRIEGNMARLRQLAATAGSA